MLKTILVIDDDERILLLFRRMLDEKKYHTEVCTKIHDAVNIINHTQIHLIIADLNLQENNGLELLAYLKTLSYYVPFIVITGYGSIESAVNALKMGAIEYVIKPFHKKHIVNVIDNALKEADYRNSSREEESCQDFENIVGQSPKIQVLIDMIKKVAPSSATVLIQGESGTGKELIARAIHNNSMRNKQKFIAVNCSVLSENLLENELFGHVKGAFTGALDYKPGLFEMADGGTLLLDEIGDMPLPMQTKLLRVLQEKEFKPLGGNKDVQTNFRLIAATNVNIKKAMLEKKFREDLYYRIAVIEIKVPPLRERVRDIPLLIDYFIKKFNKENNKKVKKVSSEALKILEEHKWTGNIRELENTIEKAVILSTTRVITANLLWERDLDEVSMPHNFTQEIIQGIDNTSEIKSLRQLIDAITKRAIECALKKTKGNRSEAANVLGMGRASFYNKMKELDIQ